MTWSSVAGIWPGVNLDWRGRFRVGLAQRHHGEPGAIIAQVVGFRFFPLEKSE